MHFTRLSTIILSRRALDLKRQPLHPSLSSLSFSHEKSSLASNIWYTKCSRLTCIELGTTCNHSRIILTTTSRTKIYQGIISVTTLSIGPFTTDPISVIIIDGEIVQPLIQTIQYAWLIWIKCWTCINGQTQDTTTGRTQQQQGRGARWRGLIRRRTTI